MKTSRENPETQDKNNAADSKNGHSSQKPHNTLFTKGQALRRQKVWLITGGVLMMALLLGFIVQSLKEKRAVEETAVEETGVQSSSLSSGSLAPKVQKEPLPASETPPPVLLSEDREGIARLEDRIQVLEERLFLLEKMRDRVPLLWQVYQRLLAAFSSEGAFENALNDFKKMTLHNMKIAKVIEELEPYAKLGAPNAEKLSRDFEGIRAEILDVSLQNRSWWEKMKWQLKSWVEIRRSAEKERDQDSPLDILQRARLEIRRQEFGAAVRVLSPLQQGRMPQLEVWLAQATAREKVDDACRLFKSQIVLEMVTPP